MNTQGTYSLKRRQPVTYLATTAQEKKLGKTWTSTSLKKSLMKPADTVKDHLASTCLENLYFIQESMMQLITLKVAIKNIRSYLLQMEQSLMNYLIPLKKQTKSYGVGDEKQSLQTKQRENSLDGGDLRLDSYLRLLQKKPTKSGKNGQTKK